MGFEMKVGDNEYDFEPNNCVINLFRNNSDMDYVAYHLGGNEYKALFLHAFCLWLGGVALDNEDYKDLARAERKLGTYAEQFGGNPRVIVDDDPDDREISLRVESLIGEAINDNDVYGGLKLDHGEV